MKKAFTLVELAIVLVIVGLLVGGVLAGQELIKQAKINKTIDDIDSLKLAVYAFKLKYDALPGDFDEATQFLSGNDVTNGDGDNKISTFPNGGPEMAQAFLHLQKAELLKGSYTGYDLGRQMVPGSNAMQTFTKDGGITILYWGGYSDPNISQPMSQFPNHVLLVGSSHAGAYETYAPIFKPADAYSIDVKLDDGKPGTGKIVHISHILFSDCGTDADFTINEYNIAFNNIACGLIIKADF